jgi:N-acetylglucosamine kinase-like BadF-type ATPase
MPRNWRSSLNPVHSRVFLGVDGGSSGTRAILIDCSAAILGFGEGGNANHAGQGFESAVSNVARAADAACAEAGVSPDQISAAHFALAGHDVEDDHIRLSDLLTNRYPCLPYRLTNDVWAGLRAGSVAGTGVAINCGSGAGAVGRTPEGSSAIIPDLGYVFGDSGGGVQIGVDAVRAVIRAWDGRGNATALTELVLELVGLPTTDALYLALYRDQLPERTFRKCTRLVFLAAGAGDAVATQILTRIGAEFGVSAAAIARKLNLTQREFPFVLSGGAIRTLQSPLVDAALARLREDCPHCFAVQPRLMPVAGAALLALDAGEAAVTEEHFAHLLDQGQAWHPEELFN